MPWHADRERRLHLARGAARAKNSGGVPWALPFEAIVAAAACRQRLNMTYTLLSQLLGVHLSTVSEAAGRVIPILEDHGITPAGPAAGRITTAGQLRERAKAAGITIAGIKTAAHHPDPHDDTPETVDLKTDAALRVFSFRALQSLQDLRKAQGRRQVQGRQPPRGGRTSRDVGR